MAISAISGQLQSYTDACEALHVTEVTLGFLSTAGEDPNMDLALYIQDKLRMSEQTEQVLKVGLASRLSQGNWPCPSRPRHSSHEEQRPTACQSGQQKGEVLRPAHPPARPRGNDSLG